MGAAAAAAPILWLYFCAVSYTRDRIMIKTICPPMRIYTPLFKAIKLFYALITRVEITSLP